MRSHRRRIHRRLRTIALGLAAGALLIPAAAFAQPTDTATGHIYDGKIAALSPSEPAAAWGAAADGSKLGDTPADFPGTSSAPVTPKVGDTPADFPGTSSAPVTPKVGDTPADFPGTEGAPEVLVAPITVPGHTIVREVNDVLPLILAGAALLIALVTAAYTLKGVLAARRNTVRPAH